MKCFIYAVSWKVPGLSDAPVKIGVTGELSTRFANYQTHSPWELEIVNIWEVPAMEGWGWEAGLHARLARHRIRGEWFKRREALELLSTWHAETRISQRVERQRQATADGVRVTLDRIRAGVERQQLTGTAELAPDSIYRIRNKKERLQAAFAKMTQHSSSRERGANGD